MRELPEIELGDIQDVKLKNQIEKVLLFVEDVVKENQALRQRVALLEEEIRRFKKQAKKPQQQNMPGIMPTQLLQEKPSGKKQWHKSSKKGVLPIDRVVPLKVVAICSCGNTTFQCLRTKQKLVQGIKIIRDNALYTGAEKQCKVCGKIYKPAYPAEIQNSSFSQELQSLVSFFKFHCRMSEPLIHRLFIGFHLNISTGEISRILLANSKKLTPTYTHLKIWGIKRSWYLQSDATGIKRHDQKTKTIYRQHLHILGHKFLSIFTITGKYNGKTMDELVTKRGRRKIYISDGGSPNGKNLRIEKKQLCWVHEIRHYCELTPITKQQQKLQEMILLKWRGFYHLAKAYGKEPTEKKEQELAVLFDTITSIHTGWKVVDKQLGLTRNKRDKLILFLDHPGIPIHNNQCEQDLREFAVIRNISGATKSLKGDVSLAIHMSILQTAQKQYLNIFETLHGLLTNTVSPFVLTAKTV